MGPEYGTPKYKEQVERITVAIGQPHLNMKEVDQLLMMYILDTDYSRAAISEARKKIEKILTEAKTVKWGTE